MAQLEVVVRTPKKWRAQDALRDVKSLQHRDPLGV